VAENQRLRLRLQKRVAGRLGLPSPIQDNHVLRRPRENDLAISVPVRPEKVMEDHRFQIDGRRWLWRYSPLKGGADGWTEYDKRKVLIHSGLKNRSRLECEIHEGLHASLPAISESAVTQTASDLAMILYSLGYRLDPEKSSCRRR